MAGPSAQEMSTKGHTDPGVKAFREGFHRKTGFGDIKTGQLSPSLPCHVLVVSGLFIHPTKVCRVPAAPQRDTWITGQAEDVSPRLPLPPWCLHPAETSSVDKRPGRCCHTCSHLVTR